MAALIGIGLLLGGFPLAAQDQSGNGSIDGSEDGSIDETELKIAPAPDEGEAGGEGAGGEDAGPEAQAAAEAAPVTVNTLTWLDYLRMLGVLAFVVGLIYLVVHLLKKAGGQNFTPSEIISLRGSRSLGSSRTLHLVEVGNQIFLVGSSEGGLTRIAEITDQETLDDIRLRYSREEGGSGGPGFAQLLWSKLRGSDASSPSSEESVQGSADFIKNQRQRLKDLE